VTDAPVLETRDLHVTYGDGPGQVQALRGVSIQVHAGEIVGLVGESGSGKSTLGFAAIGHLGAGAHRVRGEVLYRGVDLGRLTPGDLRQVRGREIAMVYQDPAASLNPALTVGTHVREVLREHLAMPGARARVRSRELLESVGLAHATELLARYPHQLSGGQQQRVVIATAIACDPTLLIMDEPTTGLDVTSEARILDLVRALKTQVRSGILYITHNLGVVARVCDRVVVLYAGEVVEEASVADAFARPRHPYTQALLAALPDVRRPERVPSPIPGMLPEHRETRMGCTFAPRCPHARDECWTRTPGLEPAGDSHEVRCWRWPEIGDEYAGQTTAMAPEASHPPGELMLEIERLGKAYGGGRTLLGLGPGRRSVLAVDDVTLELRTGETLAIVGESGSGKTTLARCVVGLVPPDRGKVCLGRRPLAAQARRRPPERRRDMQMVFQHPDSSLNPVHSVLEAIGRPLRRFRGIKGRAERRRAVQQILTLVKLGAGYLHRYPGQLSGGEKQRIAIARAIAGDPRVVVCDEPVSALDVSVQATVLSLLRQLQHQRGYAYLFISHDLSVVRHLAHRVAVMYRGQIVEQGRTEEIFTPPYHPYTEALLSAIPVPDPTVSESRIHLDETPEGTQSRDQGCRFAPRCPRRLGMVCDTEIPPIAEVAPGHVIRCHIPVAELRALQETSRHE
jgi:peptide/nickel transport system ATP-binding protein